MFSEKLEIRVKWNKLQNPPNIGGTTSPDELDPEYAEKSTKSRYLEVEPEGHAVVITGYSLDEDGKMDGIYIHDDNYGPYARVKFGDEDGVLWEYRPGEYSQEWDEEHEAKCKRKREKKCDENPETKCPNYIICLHALIIPLYPKIRLSYVEVLNKLRGCIKEHKEPFEAKLIEGKEYKKEILLGGYKVADMDGNHIDTEKIMEMLLPRFVWIIRGTLKSGVLHDIVLDSTATKSSDNTTITEHHLKPESTVDS